MIIKNSIHKTGIATTVVTLLTGLILMTSCQNDNIQEKRNTFYSELSDSVLELSFEDHKAALQFIDSLEDNNIIPIPVADYFKANSYYNMNQFKVVEFYNKKALSDNALLRIWPKAYYICSRNLANRLKWKGDNEGALQYATEAYNRALEDHSPEAKLNVPGLLMFIAMCQRELGNKTESNNNFEKCYTLSKEQANLDTSFNAQYHFSQNMLSILISTKPDATLEEVEKWIDRAEEATSRLSPTTELDKRLAAISRAQLDCTKASILIQQGETEKAEDAYQKFLASDYARTPGGMATKFRFLQLAERWAEAAELIPSIDSINQNGGKLPTLNKLKLLNEEHTIYQHAGMQQLAQEKANHLIAIIDSVVINQQQSTAEELAVIFETQQKEQKIIEQESEISLQRILLVVITLLLVILFFIFFTLHRQKETHKIEEEHHKLQKAYKQLAIANGKAEESSKMKTAFIQQISHEIRTPLNILSGFTQVITDDEYQLDTQARIDASKHIIENTNRITELVNKMLELSAIYSVDDNKDFLTTTVDRIVRRAINESAIEKASHITFSLEAKEELLNISLKTSEQRASRALTLLLDNASKFTPRGHVSLQVDKNEGQNLLTFTVEDNGIGIPPNEAEHIFEEFVQLDSYKEGAGIGLTVARSFARQLGGDVVLDTFHTGGARFIMTLPPTI